MLIENEFGSSVRGDLIELCGEGVAVPEHVSLPAIASWNAQCWLDVGRDEVSVWPMVVATAGEDDNDEQSEEEPEVDMEAREDKDAADSVVGGGSDTGDDIKAEVSDGCELIFAWIDEVPRNAVLADANAAAAAAMLCLLSLSSTVFNWTWIGLWRLQMKWNRVNKVKFNYRKRWNESGMK